jgi:hypothetical protein
MTDTYSQYADLNMSMERTGFELLPGYQLRCQKVGRQVPMLHYWFLLRDGNMISSYFGGREYCARSINAWLERQGALDTARYYQRGTTV